VMPLALHQQLGHGCVPGDTDAGPGSASAGQASGRQEEAGEEHGRAGSNRMVRLSENALISKTFLNVYDYSNFGICTRRHLS